MTQKQKLFLIGIIFLAVFFRFYQINIMPGGLFPDEAANGLDINLMQQGHLQPFYERGNGREALFFYMLWGSVELFGKGPWQHHIVSALVGVLSVLITFFLTRRLFSMFNGEDKNRSVNIALLASFLMAVNSWYVVLSRTAFRANLIPLFSTLTLYLLIASFQSKTLRNRMILALLTGASFALGFYTYIAYRIMAPILFMIIAWPLLAQIKQKQFWKTASSYKLPVISFIIGFVVFIYPIAKYFYTHPGSFVGRSGQVSVFNPELNHGNLIGTVGQVLKESMLAYFTKGDLNWRHNISGFPFLSQIISPFFGIGLVIVTIFGIWYFFAPNKRKHFWPYFLLTGWFWGMLLPVITTAEGIPHGLRSIGTIPVVFIITAWAIYEFCRIVLKAHHGVYTKYHMDDSRRSRLVLNAFKFAAAAFVLALILQTYFLYFVYAANSPENFYYFRSDLTRTSKYLVQNCDKEHTYLVLDKFSVQTTDYLTSNWHGDFSDPCNVPYNQVDPEDSWKLSNLKLGDKVIFTQSSIFDIKKFKQYHPQARLFLEYRNKFNQATMAVYKIE